MTVLRTFVALLLDDRTRADLVQLQRAMAAGLTGIRWVEPDNLHLTLRFLGDTPSADVPRLCDALAAAAGESARLSFIVHGVGAFPSPGVPPRVLWAGVRAGDELAALYRRVEDAVVQLGWPAEGRPFHPHVTLARAERTGVRGDVAAAMAREAARTWGRVPADEMTLMRSTLAPAGAIYTPVASFPLEDR